MSEVPKTIQIKIYSVLELKKILGQREIEVSVPEGITVKDLLSWMINKWGEKVSPHVYQRGSHSLLPHIRLMVNGRAIEFLSGVDTILKDGDEFLILPLLTGG